jgi:cell division protein FtsW
MFFEQKQLHADLKIFLALIASLIIIGFLFIYSSSSVYALEKFGSASYFVKKQFFGLGLGFLGLLFCRFISLDYIKNITPLLFCSSLIMTCLTLLPTFSERIHGSRRWLYCYGYSFQPSELLKISLLLYLAYFLTKQEAYLKSFRYGYLPFVSILGVVALILLKQPDFGMTVTLLITSFLLFFIVQFKTKHLVVTLTTLLPTIGALIYMRPYRWQRILTFLNPWNDPKGSGFQIIQSLIAIGSGSLLGIGISHSKQKFFYLPMQHTDFIFSIIAEETGFIGSLAIITIYFLFLYFGIRIAWQLKDSFASFLTLGFVLLISLQTIINLAVATGLAPTKGIGLPFVSYGISALLCSLCMVGVIINCVYENR